MSGEAQALAALSRADSQGIAQFEIRLAKSYGSRARAEILPSPEMPNARYLPFSHSFGNLELPQFCFHSGLHFLNREIGKRESAVMIAV